MILIHRSLPQPAPMAQQIALRVDRLTLAKRRWRAAAEDGTEFGFELDRPLTHGSTFWQEQDRLYVIQQAPEPVLEISLAIAPSAAAGIGWAVGNLHLELAAESTRMLTADEPAARQLLQRLQVPFHPTTAIFRPGRFVRGEQRVDELGTSHKH